MKNGKNPTRAQKELLNYYRLNPNNWFVVKQSHETMQVVHRHTNTLKTLKKMEA